MQTLAFVMAILGCGEGDAPCRELALVDSRYASEAQCLDATAPELLRRDDLDFPVVVAQCRPAGAAPTLLRGSEVLAPGPERPTAGDAAQPRSRASATASRSAS